MALSIRPVTPADADGIYALLQSAMPAEDRARSSWHARWLWSHVSNPWRIKEVPVGFVAESDGRIVGHLGLTPVPLVWEGETLVGQCSESFAVSTDTRGQGVGRRLSQAAWESRDVPHPVSFTANPTSRHLFARFGGVAALANVNRTRLAALDASALVARLGAGRGRLGRLLDLPGVRPIVRTSTALFIRGLRVGTRAARGWTVEGIDSGHPQLEKLAASARRPGVLAVAVDARYLAWRYEAAPPEISDRYHLVGLRDPSGELRGVAAVGERAHGQWDGTFAQLMDLVCDPDAPALSLLASLAEYGRARRWVALRIPSLSTKLNRASLRLGFVAEATPSVFSVVKPVGSLAGVLPSLSKLEGISLGLGCRW
jgi:GNAT superfamily N-acetyltransferase